MPAHKQQLEPLRRSSPLNQRNRVLSDFEAENENENENGSDDTAVLRFLRKAPKSVKLISGALQQHAESSSPPRRRSSENESNKKLYISKSGVNANDRGQYGKGRITDKGREEKMQRLINSEVFSHENSKADAEVEVEVEVQVIADKFTSSNEIDKLCGEFHSLLSALGGCLSSNENISLRSDEKISTEICNVYNKAEGKIKETSTDNQILRMKGRSDHKLSGCADGTSIGESSLIAAIQSMTYKRKDAHLEDEVGAIQNEISSQIRQLYMERAAAEASLSNTAYLSPSETITLYPSSFSKSSFDSVANDLALNQAANANTVDSSSQCEMLSAEVPCHASSMTHSDTSVTERNEERGRRIGRVNIVSDPKESSSIAIQSYSANADPIWHSDRDDLEDFNQTVHQDDRAQSKLVSLSQGSISGLNQTHKEEVDRELMEENIIGVHGSDEYTDRKYVHTYMSHDDNTFSMHAFNASASISTSLPQHRTSSDQGLIGTSTSQTVFSGNETVRSSSSVENDLNSICGSEQCSPEDVFLRRQSARSSQYGQLDMSKGDMEYRRRFEERMAEEKGGYRPMIDPDDSPPLGPRLSLVDVDDEEVDSTASGKEYGGERGRQIDEYYWEMKGDNSRSRTYKTGQRYSIAELDVKCDNFERIRERGCDKNEDENENEDRVHCGIKDVAYFSDDSLTPQKKDPLRFASRFLSTSDSENDLDSEEKDGANEDRGAREDDEEYIDNMSHFKKMYVTFLVLWT